MNISAEIILQNGREKSLERRHPWIFSGAVKKIHGQPVDGDLVRVLDAQGRFLAIGHFYEGSIVVKLLSFIDRPIDATFWKERLEKAWQLRNNIGLTSGTFSNAFRLIHGEGDELPGLVADYYNGLLVLQAHSIGMHRSLSAIAAAAIEVAKENIHTIYDKSRECLPPTYAASQQDRLLYGEALEAVIHEGPVQFHVDVVKGQKTGFFLDQRDNRSLLASYAKDKRVLNTFCYSGGFSLAAAWAGAEYVDSVDVSGAAIELTERNALLNHIPKTQHQSHKRDVMSFLKECSMPYDIVVLDPPAFAKSVSKRHNAVQGYKRLNIAGMEQVKPGGLLFTFSCSQVVDAPLFLNTVTAAAIECGRPAKILHRLSQPADHPVNIFHPEGSYLKGLVLEMG
jgi:23S rRNA (cytosine1962-C5)-methyltransferase